MIGLRIHITRRERRAVRIGNQRMKTVSPRMTIVRAGMKTRVLKTTAGITETIGRRIHSGRKRRPRRRMRRNVCGT
jgi:hypothetical protein